MKKQIKQKAADIARRLHMPPGELLDVIADAGLDAFERALTLRGGVAFPLRLESVGGRVPPGTIPVHLPAGEVLLLRELCEAADIEASADWMIEDMVACMARDSLLSKTPSLNGAPDIIASMWDLQYEDLAAMQAVVDRWNAEDVTANRSSELVTGGVS